MDLILLSGESINNKVWIEQVQEKLKDLFGTSTVLYYDHWETLEPGINFEKEFLKLPQLVDAKENYFLFAKSIGSVLALRGIAEGIIRPEKCIFVGPAFLVGERDFKDFPKWIKGFNTPSIIITKTNDPVAPADGIERLLKRYNVQNSNFLEIPGDNHKYEDLDQIKHLVIEIMQ